jgi:hypothetical protein
MSGGRIVLLAAMVTAAGAAPGSAANWAVPEHFSTIQAAVDSPLVAPGDRILVGAGDFAGAHVLKRVEIRGTGATRIVTGPLHPSGQTYGFLIGATADGAGGDGVTISHLTFLVDLAVFSRGADDVTVSHNTFLDVVQGITNRGGLGWDISHNSFTDLRTNCGGGIGIILADHQGGNVQENTVAHNHISGTVHVASGDCGGYSAPGIVLFADFRFGFAGAQTIAYNRVVKNSVALQSDTPSLVDAVAFELTDTRGIANTCGTAAGVMFDNAIGYNDFRGTANQIALTPADLDACNVLSRNLGANRGHGAHPSVFD